MTKSDLIFRYALLENLDTTGMPFKDRAAILRFRVKYSDILSDLSEQYQNLLNCDNIKSVDQVDSHNKDLVQFRMDLSKEMKGINDAKFKLSEEVFLFMCEKFNDPVKLDLIIEQRELSSDDYLCYFYSNFIK